MIVSERKKQQTARDYALETISNNIILMGLEPGQMVSEIELAQELGLSRGPVREALLELKKVKIVEVYPQYGSYISMINYNLIDQSCFLRETMECAVLERCCQYGLQTEHFEALQENLQLQHLYFENDHLDKFFELDYDFHFHLFANVGAVDIHFLIRSMMIHFDRIRAMALTVDKDAELVKDHNGIFNAVVERDVQTAQQIMRTHLSRYKIDRAAISQKFPQYIVHTDESRLDSVAIQHNTTQVT